MLIQHNEVVIQTEKLTFWAIQLHDSREKGMYDVKFYFRDAGTDIHVDLMREAPLEIVQRIRQDVADHIVNCILDEQDRVDLAIVMQDCYDEIKMELADEAEESEAQVQSEAD